MPGRGHRGNRRSGARRWGEAPARRYPRAARINEVLREVLGEELARIGDTDDRLTFVTITAVEADPDYRSATVLFASLSDDQLEALAQARPGLQAAVSRQVPLKWTPTLTFKADPAIESGLRIEEILRTIEIETPARPDPPTGEVIPPSEHP